MKRSTKLDILYIDGGAGLTVGIALFLLHDWASHLYHLPVSTIHFLATANMCYGIYALSLALSGNRKPASIALLAAANTAWMVVCIALVLLYAQTASLIGLIFIGIEGLFVFFLASYEWRNRYVLSETCSA